MPDQRHDWGPLVEDLEKRKERALGMGGPDRIERQRSLGKLTVRERLDLLLDRGTWVEYGLLADHMDAGLGDRYLAADGAVPMVAAMLGHCAAGTAYIPALADFVPMVKGTSSMALGGRHLVKAAVGEDVTEEEMGGSGVHTKISGVADLEVADDRECLKIVRKYLSFFPSHNQESPPVHESADPVDRRAEGLYRIVPTPPPRGDDKRRGGAPRGGRRAGSLGKPRAAED